MRDAFKICQTKRLLHSSKTRFALLCLAAFACQISSSQSKPASRSPFAFASGEALSYGIEWRLIYAGSAHLSFQEQKAPSQWESKLHIESGGLVSRLYKLDDNYSVEMHDQLCASTSQFDAVEGSRHRQTKVTFDRATQKATYLERDVVKNSVVKTGETEIPPCVSDVIGGFYKLRTLNIQPGQSTQLAVSDGMKSVSARVDALNKEEITTKAGKFNTIRYEAFVFNGVLFKKNARLEIWLTDDARKVPVQLRARMPFPIGTITFQLEKEERP